MSAHTQLCLVGYCTRLPAVQVAACICLFALDKHQAIPVDTHVWQLATRYYLPSLKGAAQLSPKRSACWVGQLCHGVGTLMELTRM